jgi:acyl-CoA reductase-like NAD-dependent aldehyde dehydrogenase
LQDILTNALEADTFYWATSKLDEAELSGRCLWVVQDGSREVPKMNQLVSRPDGRVVAIVDRESNVQEAAKALVAARFGFGGKSPYAPDVVLVNEWVKKDFLTAAAQHAIVFMAGENGPAANKGIGIKSRAKNSSKILNDVEKEGSARVVTSGSGGLILDIERSVNLAAFKHQRLIQ